MTARRRGPLPAAEDGRLPIAIRGHAIPEATSPRKRADRPVPEASRPSRDPADGGPPALLVFDTETTVDDAQALLFGCWRYYQSDGDGGWICVQEGLLYDDALPDTDPAGFAELTRYATTATASTGDSCDRRVELYTRSQFVEKVLFGAGWLGKARIIGFNLPFDLSRLALSWSEGRGRNLGGFSFVLSAGNAAKGHSERKHRPRLQIKHVNAHRSQISFTAAMQEPRRWLGDFVDLRTLTFALTSRGHSLASACQAFGVPGKADPGQHGVITADYIGYCRQDVAATAGLYLAAAEVLASYQLPLTPPYANSPASLAKAMLTGMGVPPVAQRHQEISPVLLGMAMSAFYGGRAECRIRRTPVPVRLLDFTSTYPTLFAVAGLWRFVIAERIDTQEGPEVTAAVQQLLDGVTVEGCFDPALWPLLAGYAQILPDGDVLPVRAGYDEESAGFGIGVNPLTCAEPLWYAIGDLVADTLLKGRAPTVIRAVKLVPVGQLPGLKPTTLPGGRLVDPRVEDPFRVMTELRQQVRDDPTMPAQAKERIQKVLKIASNSGAYGILAEYNRHDLPKGKTRTVAVHARGEEFPARVSAPEFPGLYCYPPVAAVITAGARLMLALLERCVTDAGGTWAFADTDSMAIVATQHGGPVRCDGGPLQLGGKPAVMALSYAQVEQIQSRFAALNPYDRTVLPGSILKHELDAWAYCVAAKRYALFDWDKAGRPRLITVKDVCSHGLGHLLNPLDPDDPGEDRWITQLWEHELALALTPHLAGPAPEFYERPTLARMTSASPHDIKPFAAVNDAKPWREQVKPFNFLTTVPGASLPAGQAEKAGTVRLAAPFHTGSRRWRTTRWRDLRHPGDTYRISTDPTQAGIALAPTYGSNAALYLTHPERKSLAPDGTLCGRHTTGLLRRRPVVVGSIAVIGKEANRLEEREGGQLTTDDLEEYQLSYRADPVESRTPEVRTSGSQNAGAGQ